ncbi:MAG: hypothetical protein ACREL9_14295, partial [Gemmatimonadales bacterium]
AATDPVLWPCLGPGAPAVTSNFALGRPPPPPRGSHWVSGMALGTLIGGLGGALLGAAVDESGGYGPIVGVVVGAPAGLLIGGVAGSTHSAKPRPRCGPRVRVRAGGEGGHAGWTEGTVLETQPDRIVVLPDNGDKAITVPDGAPIERLAGTKGHPLIGAVAGAAVGGFAGMALANTTKEPGMVVIAFSALGAVIGQLIRSNRWEPMHSSPAPLGVGIAPRWDGGVTLVVRARL